MQIDRHRRRKNAGKQLRRRAQNYPPAAEEDGAPGYTEPGPLESSTTVPSPATVDPMTLTPELVWNPGDSCPKRLLKLLSVYGAAGAALLQVLDYLIDYIGLPESFFPAAMLAIVMGVPVVSVTPSWNADRCPVTSSRDSGASSSAGSRGVTWSLDASLLHASGRLP